MTHAHRMNHITATEIVATATSGSIATAMLAKTGWLLGIVDITNIKPLLDFYSQFAGAFVVTCTAVYWARKVYKQHTQINNEQENNNNEEHEE